MLRLLVFLFLIVIAPITGTAQPSAASTTYTVDAPGYVSAVVRDGAGHVVRSAFIRKFHTTDTHTYTWDGFDDDGVQAPNGSYQLRTVWTPGFTSTYRAMAGTSLGLGQMPGDHRPIESLAIGDSPYLLLASRGDTTSPFESCLTKDGTTPVAEGQQFESGRVAATSGGTTDVASETAVWYTVSATQWGEAGILRKRQLRAMDREGIYKCEWNVRLPGQTSADWIDRRYGISALGDLVLLSDHDESLLRFIDCTRQANGPAGIQPAVVLHSFSGITHPIDVSLEDVNTALVTTATIVFRYNRATGQSTPLVTGLRDASAIDANLTNGDFYVIVNGGTQVRRYSRAGALRATYGIPGGRVPGPYDPTALKEVSDVASDQTGGFWISEGFPRRVAWFRDDGTHVRDLFGPQQFYNAALIDPVQRDRLWMETSAPVQPDFPTQPGLALLDSTLDRTTWNWTVNAVRVVPRAAAGDYRERWQCRVINGTRYFTLGAGFTGALVVRETAGGELVLSNVFYGSTAHETMRYGMTADEKTRAGDHWNFVYTNRGNENAYRPEDYQWSDVAMFGSEGFFDDELNYFFWERYSDNKLFKITRTGWNSAGSPTYGSYATRVLVIDPAAAGGVQDIQVHRWLKLSDGGFAALIQDESLPHTGSEWPDSLHARWWIAKFAANGTLAWKTGTKNLANLVSETSPRTGTLCVPRQFCGEINGCIVVADQVGTPAIAYTLDGVCVGQFLDSRASDGLPDHVYQWWDIGSWAKARLPANPLLLAQQTPFQYDMLKGGNVHPGESADDILWLHHGRNNTPVFSVAGWSGWVTQDAPLTLNRSAVGFDGTGLTAKYYASTDWSGTPATRIDPDLRMWFMRNRGAYSSTASYVPGDVVSSADAYYFCVQNATAVPVTDSDRWYRLDPRFVNPVGNGWYRAVSAPGAASYGNFSVAWTGQIVPFHTGTHWFLWEGDAAEIWINGIKVIDLSHRYGQAMSDQWADCRQKIFHKISIPVQLVSGQPAAIEIRMRVSSPVTNWPRGNDLFQERFSPRAALFWATEAYSARLVESRHLRPTAPPLASGGDTATASASSGGVTVSWDAPDGDNAVQIWRGIDGRPEHGALIATTTNGSFVDAHPPANASVTYWIRSTDGTIVATSNPVPFTGAAGGSSEIVNLSTRGAVDPAHPMIMGFVLGDGPDHELLLRAIGPGLGRFGISDHLALPQLRLHRMESGAGTLLSAVAAWGQETNAQEIAAAFDRTGAFLLETDSSDAACLRLLPPGAYTAVVGDGDAQGISLVELYLASADRGSGATHFRNLSARGHAGASASALIGGFVLQGTAAKRFLLRGIGPSLGNFGVADPLSRPVLRLFASDQDVPLVESGSWWVGNGGIVEIIRQAESSSGAFPLMDGSDDAAVLVELGPGAYTIHVLPAPETPAGDALIEIFAVP